MEKTWTNNLTPQDDRFSYYLGLSLTVHFCLLAFWGIKANFFPSKDVYIRSAIKVDMVALPDKKKELPAPAAEAPKPNVSEASQSNQKAQAVPSPSLKAANKRAEIKKEALAKKKASQLKKQEKAQSDAFQKLNQLSAIDKLKQDLTQNQQAKKPSQQKIVNKGNYITDGNSLEGLDRLQFEKYYDQLQAHIKQFWSLPQWLVDMNLKAQVLAKIDDRGYVVFKQILTSSGNNTFDQMALDSLDKASPCPAPPTRLKAILSTQGFVLNYP